ncbi:type VII secretion target [Rhodococcus sp. NPDC049939]|uniref:type VII secretion target n=1 Tax=Rhodococcus sp. NPDC049939 TaxID=3155511 RepID=UPI0033CA2B86
MSDRLEVDVAAVTDAGARMVRSAEVLRQQASNLDQLEFGGAQAGRDYVAKGDALRSALGAVRGLYEEWAAGTESVGLMLEDSAARYEGTDASFTENVDGVQW